MLNSNDMVYLSSGAISFYFTVNNTGVTLYINHLIKPLLLAFEHVSLQGSLSVDIASITLSALFVLAQGHTGAAQAKSFTDKQSLNILKLSHPVSRHT